jgi:non-specific serine/threonine protein kinase
LITLDPINEASHRQLMEVYFQSGQSSAALNQYQACEQLLRKELNLDPQPETRTLYKKILKGDARLVHDSKQIEPITLKNNLPLQLSSFIGRGKELSDVIRLLLKYRLVTLTGSGGVGKTRLSIKVGEQIAEDYANGVWLIELAPILDPSLVPYTTASVFGLRDNSQRGIIDVLCDYLRDKRMLLILDNCEHILDACAQLIDAVLKTCPKLKILATSRESLNITGEAIYRVPSLGLPDLQQILDAFRNYESIQLFEERAQLVQFDFSLTLENAASVAQICRQLDGIPLAIELAAAKVAAFSTEQIVKQLQESFNLLAQGSRTALPRHQTLSASINWSWNLLTESEQKLMRQISVFTGGWSLESAQAICDGDVFELTNSLIQKSLIVMHQETGRATRYLFHETIRQYANEKLVEADESESMHKRHRDWFLSLVETTDPGDNNLAWLNLLESEHDNLRTALVWSQAVRDFEIVARIAIALTEFWHMRGHIQEGRKWLESGLAHRESLSKIVLAKTLFHTCGFAVRLGDYQTPEAYAKESSALFRELGDKRNLAQAMRGLGEVYMNANERERSKPFLAEAMTLFQEVGDKRGIISVLFCFGVDAILNDEYEHGMALLNEHQTLAYELDDMVAISVGVVYLGVAEFLQGNFDESEKLFREGLVLVRPNKNVDLYTNCLEGLAAIADRRGQAVRSVRLWGAARYLYDTTGIIPGKNWVWVPRVREPTIASLRAQLGEGMFESAYAEGYAMTIDEAVKYALETAEEM